MIAVTARGTAVRSMSFSTWWGPNQALSRVIRIPSAIATSSIIQALRGEPGEEAHHQDERDQDERPRPRLAVPVVERGDRVGEDLERERGDRLVEAVVPEAVAEGGEEERRRLSRDAGDRHH